MGLEDPNAQARPPFEHREAMQSILTPKTVTLNLGSQGSLLFKEKPHWATASL